MIEGVNDVAAYQAQQLLDERYHRLNPILPSTFELDDADRLQELLDVVKAPDTEAELAQAINWLRRHW